MKNILTFEAFVNESYSVNEGAVKQFEMGMKNLINNIRRGYGWIDPEYVYDTVVNSSDFDGFDYHDIENEIFRRLIDAGLLYWTNPADPEVKGRKTSLSDLGIKESVNIDINEGTVEYIGPFVISDRLSDEELNRMWNDAMDGFSMWQKGFYYPKADYKRAYTTIENIAKMRNFKLTSESITEAKDEFVPATLTEDFEDLRRGDSVKINALEFTQGGDKETIESIRPDGKKMEIKKAILTVKI